MKLLIQFEGLIKRLQNNYPNSKLQALERSKQQTNSSESPIETANHNRECRDEPEPEKFPNDFKFPIEKVSHVLSVILADPKATHTNFLFLNELVALVFDKIRSLNM